VKISKLIKSIITMEIEQLHRRGRTATTGKNDGTSQTNTTRSLHLKPWDLASHREKRITNLMTLPTELHITISKHLSYPDALALKHTNRHFYNLVDTGVKIKVAWLVRRRLLCLPCPPHDAACDLRSDSGFCSGNVS
jgi:hypothetical protein